MKKSFQFFFVLFLFEVSLVNASDTTLVSGPSGNTQFRLFEINRQLHFTITFKGIVVIENSPLLVLLNNKAITTNTKIKSKKKYSINETYPWLGAHAIATNRCNGLQLSLKQNDLVYTLDIRVFDTGGAFRISIPGVPGVKNIPDEGTIFNLPGNSTIWYHDMEMHYESVHAKKEVSQLQQGEWVAPPATFKLQQGIYASITEADLHEYAGMSLLANGKNGLSIRLGNNQPTSYPYRLRYSPEDTLRLLKPAVFEGTIITPWRVVMIGADLNEMVNNDIVPDLCPPPDPKLFPNGIHTDWIRPGRAVWKYLNGGGDGTLEVMKKFTDGAAALGFEHNILEGFWTRWTDDDLRELVRYSKDKHVGIWLWKHSKSLRNKDSRDSFFTKCHDLGITGAKIDFFDHEAKEVIDLYETLLREGARYHVLLDFHGADKPTGLARTWPNEMIREAVKGMEASKLADRATHETTIPFTRCLAGPAEYTVMHFGERRKNTTWAHQIASAAILSGPLLTYAANPDTILMNPAVEVIKDIPATWDETIVLPGSEIGELAAFARRKGNTWFVAIMNGVQPKHIKISTSFLKNGNYKGRIVKDDSNNPAAVIMQDASFSAKDYIELDLVSGGGYVVECRRSE